MKKIITMLLAVSLLTICFSGCNIFKNDETAKPNPESDFDYLTSSDGSITIKMYKGQSETVVIPETIEGHSVTKIGFTVFNHNVTSVVIPDTVVEIENRCFYQCEKLSNVVLSRNLEKIGVSAFQDCTGLKKISIPSKVKEIGDFAFDGSGLETVVFEEGIETISGYGSFARTQLTELVLPSTVKEIGESAFASNPKLASIVLNEGLVTIGRKAFVNNPKLTEIIIPKTVRYVTEMDFNICSGLEKIMFDGNAPETFEYSDPISGVWEPSDVHFTVYYHEGAVGFSSPTWYGYTTKVW